MTEDSNPPHLLVAAWGAMHVLHALLQDRQTVSDTLLQAVLADIDRALNVAPRVSYARQLACAERELKLRKSTYSKLVREDKMQPHDAREEYDAMEAIVTTLRALADAEAGQGRLL